MRTCEITNTKLNAKLAPLLKYAALTPKQSDRNTAKAVLARLTAVLTQVTN